MPFDLYVERLLDGSKDSQTEKKGLSYRVADYMATQILSVTTAAATTVKDTMQDYEKFNKKLEDADKMAQIDHDARRSERRLAKQKQRRAVEER